MSTLGFVYVPELPSQSILDVSDLLHVSLDARRAQGYGITVAEIRAESEATTPPASAPVDLLTAQDRELYLKSLADPETGCMAQAAPSFMTEDIWSSLLPKIDSFEAAVLADHQFQEADRRWSACVALAGYALRRPDDIFAAVYERFGSNLSHDGDIINARDLDEALAFEIQLSISEFPCSTAVLETRTAVRRRLLADLITQNSNEFESVRLALLEAGVIR